MSAETSKKSWNELKGEAQAALQKKVMAVLSNATEPMTGSEICYIASHDGLWKRLRELERIGAIEVAGKRQCQITKKTAMVWRAR